MWHRYIRLFPCIIIIILWFQGHTCAGLSRSARSFLLMYIYKDCSLPSLCSFVNTNILIPVTCSAGYRCDPLLFKIIDTYCASTTPSCLDSWYTCTFHLIAGKTHLPPTLTMITKNSKHMPLAETITKNMIDIVTTIHITHRILTTMNCRVMSCMLITKRMTHPTRN